MKLQQDLFRAFPGHSEKSAVYSRHANYLQAIGVSFNVHAGELRSQVPNGRLSVLYNAVRALFEVM